VVLYPSDWQVNSREWFQLLREVIIKLFLTSGKLVSLPSFNLLTLAVGSRWKGDPGGSVKCVEMRSIDQHLSHTNTQHTTSRTTCISSRVTAIGIAQTQEDKGCSRENGVSSEVTFCTRCRRRTSCEVLISNRKGLIGLLEQVEKGLLCTRVQSWS
jgi:hypothetical protein